MDKPITKISQVDIYEDSPIFKKHWRTFILGLLDKGSVIIHPHSSPEIVKAIDYFKIEAINSERVNEFWNEINLVIEIKPDYFEFDNDLSIDAQKHMALNYAFAELKSMSLVKSAPWSPARFIGDFPFPNALKVHTLTQEGVSTALKLLEHSDNDRRHSVTVSYSKKAFWISIGALSAAIISACFNFQRLDLYEKQVTKMVVNQTAILKEVKEPKLTQK